MASPPLLELVCWRRLSVSISPTLILGQISSRLVARTGVLKMIISSAVDSDAPSKALPALIVNTCAPTLLEYREADQPDNPILLLTPRRPSRSCRNSAGAVNRNGKTRIG